MIETENAVRASIWFPWSGKIDDHWHEHNRISHRSDTQFKKLIWDLSTSSISKFHWYFLPFHFVSNGWFISLKALFSNITVFLQEMVYCVFEETVQILHSGTAAARMWHLTGSWTKWSAKCKMPSLSIEIIIIMYRVIFLGSFLDVFVASGSFFIPCEKSAIPEINRLTELGIPR